MHAVIVTNRVKRYVNGFKIMIEPLMELGYEVTWAADFTEFKENIDNIPCNIYQVNFRSNPFNVNNIKAYLQLKKLFEEKEVDLVHCNTPIGGLLGRICAKQAGIKRIIYTAHGFHFYKGSPLISAKIFKLGEQFLARYTDVLITINTEDYNAAKEFNLRNNGKLFLTHGAGIDVDIHTGVNIKQKRMEIGVPLSAIMLFSAGELNRNKNNEVIIRAMAKINNPNIYYVLCGEGKLRFKLERLAKKLGIMERVIFLGFRTDVLDILNISDIFTMTSFREGLPRSLMEAMVAGLPCIVSNIRGNKDLIEQEKGGYLSNPRDLDGFVKSIQHLSDNIQIRKKMGNNNKIKVKEFDIKIVKNELMEIYKDFK